MAARANTRNEINAQSMAKLMTGTDKTVNNLLDMLQFGEKGETITSDNKKLALEIMTRLSNPAAFKGEDGRNKSVGMTSAGVKFKLQDNGNVLAEFKLGNGNAFTIDTGLDRDGLVNKAVAVLNAAVAANPPKVEKPRVEEKKPESDDIMTAINELESGEIVGDEGELDDVVPESTETKKETGTISNEKLLNGLKMVFDALKEAKGQAAIKVLRDANMNAVVNTLLKALENARRFDSRNTEIMNNVREAFYGNKNIDIDYLLKTITDILGKKRVDHREKIDENIKNNVLDLDETLNIDALLGVDDVTGEAQVEGFNQNAKKVRDAHDRMAKKVDEKTGTTTTERRNANILGMVNRTICDECK